MQKRKTKIEIVFGCLPRSARPNKNLMKLMTTDGARVIPTSRSRVPQEDADSPYLLAGVARMLSKA